jgi:hypothetical protein
MNHVELSNKIQHFAIRRDIPGLTTLKADMKTEIERLDRWFNKYLHVQGDHMNPDNPDTKAWSLYNLKMAEYEKVSDRITSIDHYLTKFNNKGSIYERIENAGFSYSV